MAKNKKTNKSTLPASTEKTIAPAVIQPSVVPAVEQPLTPAYSFENIYNDIYSLITTHLSYNDIASLAVVNKHWHKRIMNDKREFTVLLQNNADRLVKNSFIQRSDGQYVLHGTYKELHQFMHKLGNGNELIQTINNLRESVKQRPTYPHRRSICENVPTWPLITALAVIIYFGAIATIISQAITNHAFDDIQVHNNTNLCATAENPNRGDCTVPSNSSIGYVFGFLTIPLLSPFILVGLAALVRACLPKNFPSCEIYGNELQISKKEWQSLLKSLQNSLKSWQQDLEKVIEKEKQQDLKKDIKKEMAKLNQNKLTKTTFLNTIDSLRAKGQPALRKAFFLSDITLFFKPQNSQELIPVPANDDEAFDSIFCNKIKICKK